MFRIRVHLVLCLQAESIVASFIGYLQKQLVFYQWVIDYEIAKRIEQLCLITFTDFDLIVRFSSTDIHVDVMKCSDFGKRLSELRSRVGTDRMWKSGMYRNTAF